MKHFHGESFTSLVRFWLPLISLWSQININIELMSNGSVVELNWTVSLGFHKEMP